MCCVPAQQGHEYTTWLLILFNCSCYRRALEAQASQACDSQHMHRIESVQGMADTVRHRESTLHDHLVRLLDHNYEFQDNIFTTKSSQELPSISDSAFYR
jgi:hypothetical protein